MHAYDFNPNQTLKYFDLPIHQDNKNDNGYATITDNIKFMI